MQTQTIWSFHILPEVNYHKFLWGISGIGNIRLHATKFQNINMFLIAGPVFLLLPFVFTFLYILINHCVKGTNAVCIVVLGDLGRSPRMLYHSLSFAKEGFHVDLVGYGGKTMHKELNPAVHYHVFIIHWKQQCQDDYNQCAKVPLKSKYKTVYLLFSMNNWPISNCVILTSPDL